MTGRGSDPPGRHHRPSRRSMLKRLVLLTAAVLLGACASDPAGTTQGGLRAEPVEGAAVAVTNTSDQPVYYLIVNSDAFASWRPCTSPADCPEIGGRQTVRIPYAVQWMGAIRGSTDRRPAT